jgi:AraC-like DNA-binding protein
MLGFALLAGDRLANSADSLAAIAASLGYDSESAFSVAFKRVMGVSPRQFSQGETSIPFSLRIEQSNRVDALQPQH